MVHLLYGWIAHLLPFPVSSVSSDPPIADKDLSSLAAAAQQVTALERLVLHKMQVLMHGCQLAAPLLVPAALQAGV